MAVTEETERAGVASESCSERVMVVAVAAEDDDDDDEEDGALEAVPVAAEAVVAALAGLTSGDLS